MQGKKCCIYARVSPRPERKREESKSIEGQQGLCTAYAQRKGYEVVGSYYDEGWSGGNPDRPGLADAVANTPVGGVLVVEKMDRIARDVVIEETVIGMLRGKRSSIETVAGDVVDAEESPERELMRQMMAVVAKFQRRANAARTSARMRQLRDANRNIGPPPYGKRRLVVGEKTINGHPVADARLEDNPDEQATIEAVLVLHKDGWGPYKIADCLAGFGVTNRSGGPIEHRLVGRILARHAERLREVESVL